MRHAFLFTGALALGMAGLLSAIFSDWRISLYLFILALTFVGASWYLWFRKKGDR